MTQPTKLAALVLAALTISTGLAQAAPGDLDPSFDGDGRRVLPFGGVPSEVLAQPDGKIVLAGYNQNGNFAVWRLHADGALDRSFDGDGTAVADLGGNDTVLARGGNDIVCGGAGDDRLSGGAGRDRLIAGAGRDRLIGGAGRDRLIGGPGRDRARQ